MSMTLGLGEESKFVNFLRRLSPRNPIRTLGEKYYN